MLQRVLFLFLANVFFISQSLYGQNKALNFDGSNDYVEFPSGSLIQDGEDNFTIEFWMKVDQGAFNAQGANWHGLVGRQNGGSATRNPSILSRDGELHSDMRDATNNTTQYAIYTSNLGLKEEVWYHVALVKSGAKQYLYVNAKAVDSASAPSTVQVDYSFYAGLVGSTNNYFDGSIDNLRFWDDARTPSELAEYMHRQPVYNESNLLAIYNLNEGTGTTADNIITSSTGANGTLNGPSWVDGSLGVFQNNAFNFDGSNDLAYAEVEIENTSSTGFTLDFWVKLDKINTQQNFIYLLDDLTGNARFVPFVNSSNYLSCFVANSSSTANVLTTQLKMTTNVWYHVACILDGTDMLVYWVAPDSSGKSSSTSNPTFNLDGSDYLTLGGDGTPSNFGLMFDGSMDNVRLWSEALSPHEVYTYRFDIGNNTLPNLEAVYTFDYGLGGGNNGKLDNVLFDRLGRNNLLLYNVANTGTSSNYITQDSAVPCPIHWGGYESDLISEVKNTSEEIAVPKGASLKVLTTNISGQSFPQLRSDFYLSYLEDTVGGDFFIDDYTLKMNGPIKIKGTFSTDKGSLVLGRNSYNSELLFSSNRTLDSFIVAEVFDNAVTGALPTVINNALTVEDLLHCMSCNLSIEGAGSITLRSSSTEIANVIAGDDASITGRVLSQSYFPARRAFRLVSSPVHTYDNIYKNWQANGSTIGTFGTHITGNGTNGTDLTTTGNPSLFTFDNSNQTWNAVSSTNGSNDKIYAGVPYRIMIRGDRTIDLTDNDATPNYTSLYNQGILNTSDTTITMGSGTSANADVFVGNPFHAAIDMGELLGSSSTNTNMKSNVMYIWDPTLNTRGAYVTVSLPSGSNTSSSEANEFLMPGQAAFIKTNNSGAASFTFDNAAISDQERVSTFRTEKGFQELKVLLYQTDSLNSNAQAADGAMIQFSENFESDYNSFDATKPGNIDENLAFWSDGTMYSIDSRSYPLQSERIQLFTNRYRDSKYTLVFEAWDITDVKMQLLDHFNGKITEIEPGSQTKYAYHLTSDRASSDEKRFELKLESTATGINTVTKVFEMFPNPANNNVWIRSHMDISKNEIQIFDFIGRRVVPYVEQVSDSVFKLKIDNSMRKGNYYIKVRNEVKLLVVY